MPVTVGSEVYNAGYRQRTGLMEADLFATILSLAEELDLQVYIGTIIGESYSNIEGDKATYLQDVANDGAMVIRDMYSRYNRYSSFVGFYFSDETCDMWLRSNNNEGITHFRTLYKTQSDQVRALSSTKKTMIAPAIWRYGDVETNGNNLYDLIKMTDTMTKPVVDIVASQGCLGRESTLSVSDEVYVSYETHVEQWAEKNRLAGSEFWVDAEIFNIMYMPKYYNDMIVSLEQQSKTTNSIVVFDLPSMTPTVKGHVTNITYFASDYSASQYAKRYATTYAEADKIGSVNGFTASGSQPATPRYDTTDWVKADMPPRLDGVIVNNQWNRFTPFSIMDSQQNTRYGMLWDDTYLYIGVKTNDKTFTAQRNGGWYGNAADYFTLMLSNGTDLSGNAGVAAGSAKIGITKQTGGISVQATVGSGLTAPTGEDVIAAFDDTNPDGRTAVIAVKWSWLGITPKVDNRLSLRLLYKQDGGATQSSDVYGGPEFGTFTSYTLKNNQLDVPKYDDSSLLRTNIQPLMDGRIQSNQWNQFKNFVRTGTTDNTRFVMMWDSDYLYIGVKTNDKTATVQADGGWFGDASDCFLLMMANQNTNVSGNSGVDAGSVKIGITKQTSGISIQPTLGTGLATPNAGDIVAAFDDTNPNGRTAIIALRWEWLGVNPTVNTKLPVRLVYRQDGGATQASDAYAGPEIGGFAQYALTDGRYDVPKYASTDLVKTTESPSMDGCILTNEWNTFKSFLRQGTNEDTSFGMMWDDTYLYIGIKTNDKTHTVQSDGGWFGNASDYFLLMMANQNTNLSGNAGVAAGSVKIGITKQTSGISIQPTLDSGLITPTADDVICAYDDDNSEGRTVIIAVKWSWLGITPSSDTAIPLRLVYRQDGGTTQSSDLTAGPDISGFKPYSLLP